MRTVTITKNVYQFDELTNEAKEKAREWYRRISENDEWWDFVYEDAKTIGLEITEFDTGRSEMINGKLKISLGECTRRIVANHGNQTDTYKLAMVYFRRKHNGKAYDKEKFEHDLLQEYLVMLRTELEYQYSDEQVDENIICNEHEFDESGAIAGAL